MTKNAPKIFLSSTRLDLLEERKIADRAINNNYFCINMKDWGASPDSPKEKILEELKNASALVLILGFKYGSLADGEEISYTEFEFNYAKENELDIYAFIKEDRTIENRIDEDDELKKSKFEQFRKRVEDGRTVVFFTDTEELERKILTTLNENNDRIQRNKHFTDKLFKNKLQSSIDELGPRYNPEINVNLELDFFNTMAKNKVFKEDFMNRFMSYYCELKKLKVPHKFKEEYTICLENLKNEKDVIFKDISYDFNKLYDLINNIEKILVEISKEFKETPDERHKIEVLIYQSKDHMDKLLGYSYKLLKNPVLILTGQAGCGKSHLLADLASKRMNNDEISVLLFGNHFNSDDNIGKQIVNELELGMSSTDFLEKLNRKAKYQKSRILIIIDALNESKNKQLWGNRLNRFISEIKKYKWLGLIVSIRSTYIDLIPKEIIKENNSYHHKIAPNKTFELIKIQCDNDKVNYPSFPPINPIFSNPLFLKILFDNIKKSGKNIIPQESLDFPTIISEYLNNIEKTLHNKFPVPRGFNVTEMFVKKVIELRIKNPSSKLLYEKAFEIEREISKIINRTNIEILDILIEENLFYEDKLKDKTILRFSFEKIEDHLIARHLLENIKKEDLIEEFKKEGKIFKTIAEGKEINYYGVLEEFAILLPEKFGIEIFEIDFSKYNIKDIEYKLFEWFVNSLYWRNPKTVRENVFNYIEEEIGKSEHNSTLFYESLILLSSNPNYLLNANKIHEVLIKDSMPKRDSYWLPWIDKQYRLKYSVYVVVEWAIFIKEENEFNEESLKLLTILLSWFLASNNVELRDKSTYALINLLKHDSKILLELLKLFEDVDDIYITERLYAVAYGCTLSYKNPKDMKLLAKYIYDTVFINNKLKPNILLKDYAQSLINYSNSQLHLDLDISKLKSKYDFPKIPIENEINAIEKECFTEDITGGCYILSSMHEHVGNFGRKKFKNKIKYWNYKYSYNELKNLAIKHVFELYDEDLHGNYDMSIERNRFALIHPYTHRIGEKYQKIIFYELLELLSSNYTIQNRWVDENEHYLKGAWEIGLRDFDPTFNLKDEIKITTDISTSVDFNISEEEWSETLKGLPEIENLLNQKKLFNETDDWLLLFGQLNLNDSNDLNFKCHPTKGLLLELWGLVIKKEEKEEIIEKLKYEEISQIVPDIGQYYQIFDREFSWADSYVNLKEHPEFEKILYLNNPPSNHIHVPFDENVWESDYIPENFNNSLKPSRLLFEKMNLEYGENDNVLYSNGKEVVIDLSNKDIYEYRLIIDKKELLSFLNENNLDILWLVHGFKITYENWSHDYDKQLYIEGVYYLNGNQEIVGNLTYNHYEKHYVANKESKKVHLKSCKYVKYLNKENVEEFRTINDAMNENFEPCHICLSDFQYKLK